MNAFTAATFLTHKAAEKIDDCQDSVHPNPGAAPARSFMVADGTSTGFLTNLWARLLTRRFGERPDEIFERWEEWLRESQEIWLQEAKQEQERANEYYVDLRLNQRDPAAAAFAALRFHADEQGRTPWSAQFFGDSCLFHLPLDGRARSYVLTRSAQFQPKTDAVDSYRPPTMQPPRRLDSTPAAEDGGGPVHAAPGDAFLLATDAFSKWMLARAEQGLPVWKTILDLTADNFETLIHDARRDQDCWLENDDVALTVIQFGPAHPVYDAAIFVPRLRVEAPANHPAAVDFEAALQAATVQSAKRSNPSPPVRSKKVFLEPVVADSASAALPGASPLAVPAANSARSKPVRRPRLAGFALTAALALLILGNILATSHLAMSLRSVQQQTAAQNARLRQLEAAPRLAALPAGVDSAAAPPDLRAETVAKELSQLRAELAEEKSNTQELFGYLLYNGWSIPKSAPPIALPPATPPPGKTPPPQETPTGGPRQQADETVTGEHGKPTTTTPPVASPPAQAPPLTPIPVPTATPIVDRSPFTHDLL